MNLIVALHDLAPGGVLDFQLGRDVPREKSKMGLTELSGCRKEGLPN